MTRWLLRSTHRHLGGQPLYYNAQFGWRLRAQATMFELSPGASVPSLESLGLLPGVGLWELAEVAQPTAREPEEAELCKPWWYVADSARTKAGVYIVEADDPATALRLARRLHHRDLTAHDALLSQVGTEQSDAAPRVLDVAYLMPSPLNPPPLLPGDPKHHRLHEQMRLAHTLPDGAPLLPCWKLRTTRGDSLPLLHALGATENDALAVVARFLGLVSSVERLS